MIRRRNPATVRDVARGAGVSTATVSRVLNGDRRVAPATRDRVLSAARDLDYRMNRTARALKTRKSRTVGIVAPEFRNDFFMNVVTGIEAELHDEGYGVLLCSSDEDPGEEAARLALLREKGVDGVLLIPASSETVTLDELGSIPSVLVDRLVVGVDADAVLSENFEGVVTAVETAIRRGARRIGFIGGDLGLTSARERYDGFLAALERGGLKPDREIVLFGDYHRESGRRIMRDLMERADPPSWVFISNFFMHLGAAEYLTEAATEIPDDLRIIAFDSMAGSALFPRSALLLAQPMDEIGREAARLLLSRIRGEGLSFPTIRRLPVTLVERPDNG